MRISLNQRANGLGLPAYRKVFGYILTYKYKITNPEYLPEYNKQINSVKQTKFSKLIQKCLEKLFPECNVRTKAQFKNIHKGFIDQKILDNL